MPLKRATIDRLMMAWESGYEAGKTEGSQQAHAASIRRGEAKRHYEQTILDAPTNGKDDED